MHSSIQSYTLSSYRDISGVSNWREIMSTFVAVMLYSPGSVIIGSGGHVVVGGQVVVCGLAMVGVCGGLVCGGPGAVAVKTS